MHFLFMRRLQAIEIVIVLSINMSQIYDMYYVKVAINFVAEPSDEQSHVFFASS